MPDQIFAPTKVAKNVTAQSMRAQESHRAGRIGLFGLESLRKSARIENQKSSRDRDDELIGARSLFAIMPFSAPRDRERQMPCRRKQTGHYGERHVAHRGEGRDDH